jgi:hypothetical protein
MRTAFGALFFTLGFLLGIGAMAALLWRPDPFGDFAAPGTDGLMALLGVACAGWAVVCLSLGYYLLRSGAKSTRPRWPVIAATVLGALAGLGWYLAVEARSEGRQPKIRDADDGGYQLRIPAFGHVLERDGGQFIEWTDANRRRHYTEPNGVQAKFYMWVTVISLGYAALGGLAGGSLAVIGLALIGRRA